MKQAQTTSPITWKEARTLHTLHSKYEFAKKQAALGWENERNYGSKIPFNSLQTARWEEKAGKRLKEFESFRDKLIDSALAGKQDIWGSSWAKEESGARIEEFFTKGTVSNYESLVINPKAEEKFEKMASIPSAKILAPLILATLTAPFLLAGYAFGIDILDKVILDPVVISSVGLIGSVLIIGSIALRRKQFKGVASAINLIIDDAIGEELDFSG